MHLLLFKAWRRIRSSYWFLPSLMVIGAVALAFLNLYLDRQGSGPGDHPPHWLAVADAESARSLLATIAGSMMTVAGVTFSIVIVALTLASSQFGPRLLEGFMRDTGNQVVLGTFVSVFIYCLIVMLHLPGDAGSRRLPQTSVLTGLALAFCALGVLIYFFHHISTSIQADELILVAGQRLQSTIEATLPETGTLDEQGEVWPPAGFSEANSTVKAPRTGYLSAVDLEALAKIAREGEVRVMVASRPGDYLLEGQRLALVTPAQRLNAAREEAIAGVCAVTSRRSQAADLPLAINRLTEIAVRALSPGINDPYTALEVIDGLSSGLDEAFRRLARRSGHGVRSEAPDDDGGTCVYLRMPSGEELLEQAFGPILTYGCRDVRILSALLRALQRLGARCHGSHLPVLAAHAEKVAAAARSSLALDDEKKAMEALFRKSSMALSQTYKAE